MMMSYRLVGKKGSQQMEKSIMPSEDTFVCLHILSPDFQYGPFHYSTRRRDIGSGEGTHYIHKTISVA